MPAGARGERADDGAGACRPCGSGGRRGAVAVGSGRHLRRARTGVRRAARGRGGARRRAVRGERPRSLGRGCPFGGAGQRRSVGRSGERSIRCVVGGAGRLRSFRWSLGLSCRRSGRCPVVGERAGRPDGGGPAVGGCRPRRALGDPDRGSALDRPHGDDPRPARGAVDRAGSGDRPRLRPSRGPAAQAGRRPRAAHCPDRRPRQVRAAGHGAARRRADRHALAFHRRGRGLLPTPGRPGRRSRAERAERAAAP